MSDTPPERNPRPSDNGHAHRIAWGGVAAEQQGGTGPELRDQAPQALQEPQGETGTEMRGFGAHDAGDDQLPRAEDQNGNIVEPCGVPDLTREQVELTLLHCLLNRSVFDRAAELLPADRLARPSEVTLQALWRAAQDIHGYVWPLPVPTLREVASHYITGQVEGQQVLCGIELRDLDQVISRIANARPDDYPEPLGHDWLTNLLTERLVRWPFRDEFRVIDGQSVDPVTLAERYRPVMDRIQAGLGRQRPRILRPGESLVAEPVPWTVHGLLKRVPTLWVGPSKTMKSKMVLDFAVAVGTGGMTRALGHWSVIAPLDPGERGGRTTRSEGTEMPEGERVLYLVGEDEADETYDMLLRVCRARGTTHERCGVTLVFDPPMLSTGVNAILAMVREHRSTLVVLDTASALDFAGADKDNVANMHVMVPKIQELCRALTAAGAVPWIVHHTTKWLYGRTGRENYAPMERNHTSGAGWAEAMKQFVMINRSEPFTPGEGPERVWLQLGNRSRSTLRRVTLNEGMFNPSTGYRHGWHTTVETPEQAEAAAEQVGQANDSPPEPTPNQAALMNAITAHLTAAGDWVRRRELLRATNRTREVLQPPLDILISRGTIVEVNRPGLGYHFRMADTTSVLGPGCDLGDVEER